VGGNIAQPALISSPKPVYPPGARAAGGADSVRLQGVVSKDGTVMALQLENPQPGLNNPELIQAAMDAVKQWRYQPGKLNGEPIEMMTTITVNFTLQ